MSEIAAAEAAGFAYSLYALEDARGRTPTLRHCPEGGGEALLHRGWMMSDVAYTRLFDAAAARGHTLVVDPAGYAEAHYSPCATSPTTPRPPCAWRVTTRIGRSLRVDLFEAPPPALIFAGAEIEPVLKPQKWARVWGYGASGLRRCSVVEARM